MPNIVRGFRGKLSQFFDVESPLTVRLAVEGPDVYDFSCFCVNDDNQLTNEKFMVFYNNLATPDREISLDLEGPGAVAVFTISLTKMPRFVTKLAFTVSVDGPGVMSGIRRFSAVLSQGGQQVDFELAGSDFADEKAVIGAEIYFKAVWRLSAVGAGFNGGLGALLEHYGGVVADDVQPSGGDGGGDFLPPPPESITLAPPPESISLAPPPESVSLAAPPESISLAAPPESISLAPPNRQEPPLPPSMPPRAPSVAGSPAGTPAPSRPSQGPVPPMVPLDPAPLVPDPGLPALSLAPAASGPALPPASQPESSPAAGGAKPQNGSSPAAPPAAGPLAGPAAGSAAGSDALAISGAALDEVLKTLRLDLPRARVGLAVDKSASMRRLNRDRAIERAIAKLMPLALRWDGWKELDFWYYDKDLRKEPPVTRDNYLLAGPADWESMASGENVETQVLFGTAEEYRSCDEPAFVLVLTDGAVVGNGEVLARSMDFVSKSRVFWHFACLRRVEGNILERLVQQPTQAVGNIAFSLLDDFEALSDQYLYFRWLQPFARWLDESKRPGGEA